MESNFTGVIYNQFPTTTYVWGQPPPEVLDRISQFVFLRRNVGGVTEADDTLLAEKLALRMPGGISPWL